MSAGISPSDVLHSHKLAPAMLLPFSASRELLARQRGPLEHRASGALTGPRAPHLLALTTASRPGIPTTTEACLGSGTYQRRALSNHENEKGEQCRNGTHSCNLILSIINFKAKAFQVLYIPPWGLPQFLAGNKRRETSGSPGYGHRRRRRHQQWVT